MNDLTETGMVIYPFEISVFFRDTYELILMYGNGDDIIEPTDQQDTKLSFLTCRIFKKHSSNTVKASKSKVL